MGLKKKAQEKGGEIVRRKHPYKVLGQLGMYKFTVYKTPEQAGWFGCLVGKSYYQTSLYKQITMYLGACNCSYRISAEMYNFINKQTTFKLSHKTIEAQVWKEGQKINEAIKSAVEKVNSNKDEETGEKKVDFTYVCQEKKKSHISVLKKDISEKLKQAIDKQETRIEDKAKTIYIEIDDICCKEQKSSRTNLENNQLEAKQKEKTKKARKKGKKAYKESKYLFHTVTLISKKEKGFRILSKNQNDLTDKLNAFITVAGKRTDNWIFIVDGHRPLQSYIKKMFNGKPMMMILDWYHLQKKVRSQLMMGMKRTEKREDKFYEILEYLWYGLTKEAQESISAIQEEDKKNKKSLELLIGYIKRQQELIPNYALRKSMKLKNSSNRVEKENDRLIAHRQKKNGMSWSKKGSFTLGLLQMIKLNKQIDSFHETGKFEFKWAA